MRLESFKNKYESERAFIIGNGPSLAETPLEALDDEYTFAMNKINLLYDETDWRPSFFVMAKKHTVGNHRVLNYMKTISLGIPAFVAKKSYEHFPEMDNIYPYNRTRLTLEGGYSESDMRKYTDKKYAERNYEKIWSTDIADGVLSYASTMYDTIQIANYMGFDQLYLLGCDLGYENKVNIPHIIFDDGDDPTNYDSPKDLIMNSNNKLKSIGNGIAFKTLRSNIIQATIYRYLAKNTNLFDDPNHFDDSYTMNQGHRKDINEQLNRSHEIINNVSDIIGFSIYNATMGGDLEVYERLDLLDLL